MLHDLFHVTINGNKFVLKFHDQPVNANGTLTVLRDNITAECK